MAFEETLANSLKSIAENAKAPDATITNAELELAAKKMANVGYDFTRTNKSLDALRHYLEGKSIILAGTVGVGKTEFFRSLQKSGVARHGIVIYSLTEHGGDFTSVIVDDIKGYANYELVVDDVGTESNWSGRRDDDILSRIIAVREGSRMRTHFTTNLTKADIASRYDERVKSRMRLCVLIPTVGADNRAATANPAEVEFRAKCADPNNWILCKDKCEEFKNGKCQLGETVPPLLEDTTPEEKCGVGKSIPYKQEYLEFQAQFKARRRRWFVSQGMDPPDHLKEGGTR